MKRPSSVQSARVALEAVRPFFAAVDSVGEPSHDENPVPLRPECALEDVTDLERAILGTA